MPIETFKSKPVSAYTWYSQTVKKWLVNTINNFDSLKANCCDFVLNWIRFFDNWYGGKEISLWGKPNTLYLEQYL